MSQVKTYEVIVSRELEEYVAYTVQAESAEAAEALVASQHADADQDAIEWQMGDLVGMPSVGDAQEVWWS